MAIDGVPAHFGGDALHQRDHVFLQTQNPRTEQQTKREKASSLSDTRRGTSRGRSRLTRNAGYKSVP